jgi:hypothetical protein
MLIPGARMCARSACSSLKVDDDGNPRTQGGIALIP